jgi:hypothetical protein
VFLSKSVKSLKTKMELKGPIEFCVIRDEKLWLRKLLCLRFKVNNFRLFDLGEETAALIYAV